MVFDSMAETMMEVNLLSKTNKRVTFVVHIVYNNVI